MPFVQIKIYPEIGDIYSVKLPDSVAQADNRDAAIEAWVLENLNFVDHWEYEKSGLR